MDNFTPYLVSAAIACLIAQGLKVVFAIHSKRSQGWRSLFKSGHMPSTHSATATALAASVGVATGIQSAVFAIALIFAVFISYDAMRVRRATGEQGIAINELIAKSNAKIAKPYYSRGHKPTEVLAGAVLGTSVGLIVAFFATK